MKTTIKDCKPTVVNDEAIMSGEGVFIESKEQARKYCIEKRGCDNLTICFLAKEKLDRGRIDEALDLLDY